MPNRLPLKDILNGLFKNILKAIKFWLHSTLVAISWLGIVPLTACRIHRCLFTGSVGSLLTLPLDMLSTENIISDIFQGGFVVLCSLGAFIGLVWLREQILSGGGPEWLNDRDVVAPNENVHVAEVHVAENQLNEDQNDDVEVDPDQLEEHQNNHENEFIAEGNAQVEDFNPIQNPHQQIVPDHNAEAPPGDNNNNWNHIEWDRAADDLTWDRVSF